MVTDTASDIQASPRDEPELARLRAHARDPAPMLPLGTFRASRAARCRVEGSMPGSPSADPRRSVGQLLGGLMIGGPSGGKAGPPRDRFITVQESDMPRPAKTKTT